MKKILAYFQQVGGANALLPLFNRWGSGRELIITGRPLVCDNLRGRNIAAVDPADIGRGKNSSADWLDRIKPDLIITDTVNLSRIPEHENCRDLWQLAGENGIPSVGYVDSWGAYKERFNTSEDTGMPIMPDVIAVIDDIMKNAMLSAGFPEKRLAVLGNPRFDILHNQGVPGSSRNKTQLCEDEGVQGDPFLMAFVSEPIEKYHYPDALKKWGFTEKTILSELIDTLNKLPEGTRKDLLLAVLVHPEEDEDELRASVIDKHPDFRVSYYKGEQTLEVIAAADLVAGMLSMLLVEAVVLQRPVISLQLDLKQKDYLVTNLVGATTAVHRREELSEVLLRSVTENSYRESLLMRQQKFLLIADSLSQWDNAIDKLLVV